MEHEEIRHLNGSWQANRLRRKMLDGLQSEMFNGHLHDVIMFLNKNGYITQSQFETAENCKLKSIHGD